MHYTQMYEMLRNIAPPVGFGRKCPYRLAYKHLIRYDLLIISLNKENLQNEYAGIG